MAGLSTRKSRRLNHCLALSSIRRLREYKDMRVNRRNAVKPRSALFHLMDRGSAIHQPEIPRRRIHRHHLRAASCQQLFRKRLTLAVRECEIRQHDPVEKTFEQRGDAAPPHRIRAYQAIGQRSQLPGLVQVRLQFLGHLVSVVQDRIECQAVEFQQRTSCPGGADSRSARTDTFSSFSPTKLNL